MNRLTAAEWAELYEALQVLKSEYEAQCPEVQSVYMLQICLISRPEPMEV